VASSGGSRDGLRSGCYPLDVYYKALPEATEMKAIKARTSDAP
jgi:hypothetical protein